MKTAYSTHVFISAELDYLPEDENDHRTEELQSRLDESDYIAFEVTDYFKGVARRSFLIQVEYNSDIDTLLLIAADFYQKTIKVIQPDGTVQLHYTDGRMHEIGLWASVPTSELSGKRSYIEISGLYYAAI